MKKTFERVMAIVLTVIMIVGMLPVNAFAAGRESGYGVSLLGVDTSKYSISGTFTIEQYETKTLSVHKQKNSWSFETISNSNIVWTSENDAVFTVNSNGVITGVSEGSANVVATITAEGETFTKKQLITVKEPTSVDAEFYYYDYGADLDNSYAITGGVSSLGDGEVITSGISWSSISLLIYTIGISRSAVNDRVLSWPSSCPNGIIDKTSAIGQNICNTFTNNNGANVESIRLVPYKVTRTKGIMSSYTYNVYCSVKLKEYGKCVVSFYLHDADDEEGAFNNEWSGQYSVGETVSIPTTLQNLPNTKTGEGNTKNYQLVAWYDNDKFSGNEIVFPYAIQPGETYKNFYAKYVEDYVVSYDLQGGNVSGGNIAQSYKAAGVPFYIDSRTPTKEGHTFKGWVENNTTYQPGAYYAQMPNHNITFVAEWEPFVYTITWKNGNDVLKTEQVEYGKTPVYSGTTPTKAADAQYTYAFSGWDPAVTAVTGAATYTAQFNSTVNKYTVTWKNGNDVLKTEQVEYGTTPVYSGTTPTKAADAQYTYTFSDWDPAVTAVTGAATYTAQFSSTTNEYEITFVDGDGKTIQSGKVPYGTTPAYNGATPTKTATAQYTYSYTGWDKTIAPVAGEATYTAQFDSTVNKYTVTWKNGNDVLKTEQVEYGTTPVYSGATPTKAADAQYTYTFSGWDPAVTAVTGAATYTAQFNSTVNKYTVSFDANGHGTAPEAQEIEYGQAAAQPADPSATGYTFGGWYTEQSCENAYDFSTAVTAARTLYAKWTKNSYTISYDLAGGAVATENPTTYDVETADITLNNPTKTGYTFAGWTGTDLSSATTNVTIAKGSTGARSYVATWTPVEYTLTYELDGGALESGKTNPDKYTIESENITLNNPYKQNYKFIGWKEGDADPVQTVTITQGSTGARSFTANYELDVAEYTVHHYLDGTTVKVAEDVTGSETIGTEFKPDDATAFISGYEKATRSRYSTETGYITIAASGNEIIVYYHVPLTLTAGSDEKDYDGTALTCNGFDISGLVNGDSKADFSVTMTAESTITDYSDTPAANVIETVTYKSGDVPSYYNIGEIADGQLQINKKAVTITADDSSKTYGDTDPTLTATVEGKPASGADVNYKVVRETGENVGEYKLTVVPGDNPNYTITPAEGVFTISKRSVVLTSASDSKMYDGNALTNETVTVSGDGWADGEGATYSVTGSQLTTGSSDNSFTYTLNDGTDANNYTIEQVYGKLIVKSRDTKFAFDVETNSATAEYNGKEQTVFGFETLEFTVNGNKYTVSGISAEVVATDAGYYPIEVIGTPMVTDEKGNDVTAQFAVNTKSGFFEITPKPVTVTTLSANKPYDGTALTAEGSIEGIVDGETYTFTVTGSQTAEGESDNTYSIVWDGTAKAENYEITDTVGKLTVEKVTDTVTVTIRGNNEWFRYDGTEKTAEGYEVVSISNPAYKESDFRCNGEAKVSAVTAATYPMNLKASDFQNLNTSFTNVKFVVEDGFLVIDPVEHLRIKANSASKRYDGTPLTNNGYSYSNVLIPGDQLFVTINSSVLHAEEGTVPNEIAEVKIMRGNVDVTNCYVVEPQSGSLVIVKRDVFFQSASNAKYYDGEALTNSEITIGGLDGFAPGEGAVFTVTGSQTEVGSSKNTFTYTLTGGAQEGDYNIYSYFGTLTVASAREQANGEVQSPTPLHELKVHFVDEDGNAVAEDYTAYYVGGDSYARLTPVVDGFVADSAVVEGVMPDADEEITVIYHPFSEEAAKAYNYTLETISEENVPLATLLDDDGSHNEPSGPFLAMVISMMTQAWYISRRKKYQKKIYETKAKIIKGRFD